MALFVNDNNDALRVVSGLTNGQGSVHGDNFTLYIKCHLGVHQQKLFTPSTWGDTINYFCEHITEYNLLQKWEQQLMHHYSLLKKSQLN